MISRSGSEFLLWKEKSWLSIWTGEVGGRGNVSGWVKGYGGRVVFITLGFVLFVRIVRKGLKCFGFMGERSWRRRCRSLDHLR